MNLLMGSHIFRDVSVPLLWGSRAVLQDKRGRISVIDLAGDRARLEVLGDKPAPEIAFTPRIEGFSILSESRQELYLYMPTDKRLTSQYLSLPDCQILADRIMVGTNTFSSNMFVGSQVGIAISESGIGIGGALPPGLAHLEVKAS